MYKFFRHLFPQVVTLVEKLELNVELENEGVELDTIEDCTLKCVQIIQKCATKLVKRRPNDFIFLAGWGTSATLNHKVFFFV